jgi:hypothetical protein
MLAVIWRDQSKELIDDREQIVRKVPVYVTRKGNLGQVENWARAVHRITGASLHKDYSNQPSSDIL